MFLEYHDHALEREQHIARSILIVEDDEDIGAYLVTAIKQETAHHPQLVMESQQALEAVKHIKPDLFLLDYRLRDCNGIDLYDQLHAMSGLEAIPAIIMSASLPEGRLEEEIKQRQLFALSNPHTLDELIETLEQALLVSAGNAC
jgi:DNA-binding NtrC family response regulator